MKPAVVMDKVGVTLGQFEVLKGVSAVVPAHKQTIVVGPNGAGKSTLMLALMAQKSHSGSIVFNPESPRFGYVPQRLAFDRHLPLTTCEYLSLGQTRRPLWLGCSRRLKQRITDFLETVQAAHLLNRSLGVLSGGEMQRVLLASALMADPDILILDEPATGVDVYGEQLLCELLNDIKKDLTIIMVSHDLSTAKAHGDWIICLNRRVIAQGQPGEIFQPGILAATFGLHQGLLFNHEHKSVNQCSGN